MRLFSRLLLASLVCGAALHAQNKPQTRKGFTISFGFGGGSATFDCAGCSSEGTTSGTGYLRIGGAIRPNIILAGQAEAWSKSENGATLTAGTVDAIVQWYPAVDGGFFVEAGVGGGSIEAGVTNGSITVTDSRTGFGYNVGAGYDLRLGKNFSLSPYVSYFAASAGGSSYGSSSDKLTAKVFHFGLGFTWH